MLRLLSAILGIIEVLVGLRFVFRLFGANPDNAIVNAVYNWSTPFVAPFAGIFGQSATVTNTGLTTTGVFDWTALIALVVYGLIAAVLARSAARVIYR
jgi:uncharacterized protein YggT (Ycf19 family)